ncbi:MAG: Ig-like domain-containing protein [Firmicutes bacterium]|nr:Ig-like domain-containing protein [Bacillota bacterium]
MKEKMKQKMSLLLTLVMIFALLPAGVFTASANGNLIFELGITGGDGAATQANVSNTVAGNSSVLSVVGTPMISEFFGSNGTKRFLAFGDNVLNAAPADNQLNRAMVAVQDAEFINKDTLTFETWFRPKNTTTAIISHPFSIISPSTSTDSSAFEILANGDYWYIRAGGNYQGAQIGRWMTDYISGNWMHMVTTRQWNPATNRWVSKTYINGAHEPTLDIDAIPVPAPASNPLRKNENGYVLGIGNANQNNGLRALKGDIATFKVYNKILTASEALDNYNATVMDFVALPETMQIENVTPEGGVINSATDEIKIDFNNYVDKNTLSGITFKKSGDSANIGVVKTAEGVIKTVRVEYPSLDEGANYVLTIPATVKSINNYSVEPAVYNYSAWTDALVFELNISGTNGQAATVGDVSNKVAGSTSVLGIKGTPMINEYQGSDGIRKYLSFGDNVLDAAPADNQLNRAMVSVEDANFINKDALTFETWIRPKNTTNVVSYHPFSIVSPLTTTDYSAFEIFTVGNYWYMRAGGNYKGAQAAAWVTDYADKWIHMVVTRQWNGSKWTSFTYLNGVRFTGFDINNVQPSPTGRKDEVGYVLGIGNANQSNGLRALKGDIGSFKVYNKIFTPQEALAKYYATAAGFTEPSDTMEIESVTPADGLLNPAEGEITINFSDFVDKNTLGDITLKKSGDAVNKGAVKTDEGSTKIVRVEYSSLDEGVNYVLTIPATIKNTGNVAVVPGVYNFRTWSDSLVFELDITGASGAATESDISNAVSGSNSGMEILGTLMLGSFQSHAGDTKYISIGNSEIAAVDGENDPLNRSAILVDSDYFRGQNEMTIETWIKPKWMSNAVNGYGINYPFSLSNGIINASSFETMILGDSFYVRPGGASGPVTLTNMSDYNDGWMHVAITRKWNNPGSTSGTWSYETFVNGNKIDELSQTTASTTRISETDHLLAIGHSSWNGDNDSRRTRSFRGDVAMFKVYNKLLTPVDMLANYNATSDNFNTAYTGFENGVVFEDEFGGQVEVSSLVSGQQVNANAKVINIDGSITSIYSILAIYDRGELVGIDIKPAAVSNGEANISNTLVPVNIKPEGVYEIKLFVWNDMATIKPILATEYCL